MATSLAIAFVFRTKPSKKGSKNPSQFITKKRQ
jgi:hypothetical protein